MLAVRAGLADRLRQRQRVAAVCPVAPDRRSQGAGPRRWAHTRRACRPGHALAGHPSSPRPRPGPRAGRRGRGRAGWRSAWGRGRGASPPVCPAARRRVIGIVSTSSASPPVEATWTGGPARCPPTPMCAVCVPGRCARKPRGRPPAPADRMPRGSRDPVPVPGKRGNRSVSKKNHRHRPDRSRGRCDRRRDGHREAPDPVEEHQDRRGRERRRRRQVPQGQRGGLRGLCRPALRSLLRRPLDPSLQLEAGGQPQVEDEGLQLQPRSVGQADLVRLLRHAPAEG